MSILSIDVGSSRCKVAIFGATGEMFALRSAGYTAQQPHPGYAELDPEVFFRVVTSLSREVCLLRAEDPVEAVCLSSHGETFVPIGADGKPLCPAILNTDVRAVREAAWYEQQLGRNRLFALTGHTSHTMYPVPKLLWLKRNAPEIFSAARRFSGVTDYVLSRLGLEPLIDYSHAARFMCLDINTRAWSDEVLALGGIDPRTLPTPVQAGTIAGTLGRDAAASLGVPEGIPAVVGGHDQVVSAVGLGVLDGGRAAGSLGTYECVLVVSDQPQLNRAALDASLNTYPHAVPGKFVTVAYFPSGIMMEWLDHLLYGATMEDADAHWKTLEEESHDGPTGLLITPHLIGSCSPEFDSAARAGISGLTPDSTRSQLYKGVLEGIASEFALVTGCLESAGSSFQHINVSGGGARSPLGMRLRAALAAKQLHIMRCQESVCLGGAMLASVALGIYPDLATAASIMVREKECTAADTGMQQLYRSQLAGYRQFRSTLVRSQPNSFQHTGE